MPSDCIQMVVQKGTTGDLIVAAPIISLGTAKRVLPHLVDNVASTGIIRSISYDDSVQCIVLDGPSCDSE
uniref:Uncharacterized protein n=1 Tax=Arundo donax TaxID=35708 RepID=A0A0A9C5M6_ARUDO